MAYTLIPCASHKGFKYLLHLDGELTVEQVDEDIVPVQKLLKKSGGVIIDGSLVTKCDGAGLQLISALLAELDRQNRPAVVEQISSALDDAGILYGADLLGRYPREKHMQGGSHESA